MHIYIYIFFLIRWYEIYIKAGGYLSPSTGFRTVVRLSTECKFPRAPEKACKSRWVASLLIHETMSYCRFLLIMPFTAGRNEVYFENVCEKKIYHPMEVSGCRKSSSDSVSKTCELPRIQRVFRDTFLSATFVAKFRCGEMLSRSPRRVPRHRFHFEAARTGQLFGRMRDW